MDINQSYEMIREQWSEITVDSVESLEHALDNFRILFAYHSGKLENEKITYHDTREIFCDGNVSGFTGDPRAIFEQQNQKTCYNFLLDKIINKEPITSKLIKEIHAALMAGTYDERRYIKNEERPGEYKKRDYIVGINEVGYPPEEVETGIEKLLEEINELESKDILTVGAYFHCKFEYIHPFADGNGRTGRTLLNYFFLINGHPPIVIHSENKAQYNKALETYDVEEQINPMKDFLIKESVATWERQLLLKDSEIQKERKGLDEYLD